MQARDVMTSPAISLGENASVQEAAALMAERRVSAIPVVDDSGGIVGIVSEGDLFQRRELGTERRRSWWLDLFANPVETDRTYLRETANLLSSVMTRDVVTVGETTPLSEIADILAEKHVKRVPVVDGDRLVGIVSRADIVRAFATTMDKSRSRTSDDDRTIRDAVIAELEYLHSIQPGAVNVIVEAGQVSIWSVIESEERRLPIIEAIKNIPGVKSVRDHLTTMPAWYGAA